LIHYEELADKNNLYQQSRNNGCSVFLFTIKNQEYQLLYALENWLIQVICLSNQADHLIWFWFTANNWLI